MVARRVNVVPHTHWDREWYSPYQKFRLRLVDMLDKFLPALDADPSFSHFLLDGQMAVVDDYLEVRPEAAPVLQRLAREGRLAMGPWVHDRARPGRRLRGAPGSRRQSAARAILRRRHPPRASQAQHVVGLSG